MNNLVLTLIELSTHVDIISMDYMRHSIRKLVLIRLDLKLPAQLQTQARILKIG